MKSISFLREHTHDSALLKRNIRETEKQVVKDSSGNLAISSQTVHENITNAIQRKG